MEKTPPNVAWRRPAEDAEQERGGGLVLLPEEGLIGKEKANKISPFAYGHWFVRMGESNNEHCRRIQIGMERLA